MGKNRPPKSIRHLTRVLLIGLAFVYFHLSAQAAGQLIVHDFIPDLTAFLRSAPPQRESSAKLFAQLVIRPHPEVYNRPQIFKTDLSRQIFRDRSFELTTRTDGTFWVFVRIIQCRQDLTNRVS